MKGIDYSTDLGVSGPDMSDIWVDVNRARSLISEIWDDPPHSLVELTSPIFDRCWSLFDRTRHSVLHNWSLDTISPAAYSTSLLLSTIFSVDQVIHQEDRSQWIRTGMPEPTDDIHEQDVRERAILNWSVAAAERYLLNREALLHDKDWSLVVSSVMEFLGTSRSDERSDQEYRDVMKDFDVSMATSFEKLLAVSRARGDTRVVARAMKSKTPELVSCARSTQTEVEQLQEALVMQDVACQTDAIPTSRDNLSWYLTMGVVVLMCVILQFSAIFSPV